MTSGFLRTLFLSMIALTCAQSVFAQTIDLPGLKPDWSQGQNLNTFQNIDIWDQRVTPEDVKRVVALSKKIETTFKVKLKTKPSLALAYSYDWDQHTTVGLMDINFDTFSPELHQLNLTAVYRPENFDGTQPILERWVQAAQNIQIHEFGHMYFQEALLEASDKLNRCVSIITDDLKQKHLSDLIQLKAEQLRRSPDESDRIEAVQWRRKSQEVLKAWQDHTHPELGGCNVLFSTTLPVHETFADLVAVLLSNNAAWLLDSSSPESEAADQPRDYTRLQIATHSPVAIGQGDTHVLFAPALSKLWNQHLKTCFAGNQKKLPALFKALRKSSVAFDLQFVEWINSDTTYYQDDLNEKLYQTWEKSIQGICP